MDIEKAKQDVQKVITKVTISLTEGREKIMNLQLNDLGNDDVYKKNIELIENSKQQIHHITDQYFKDLSDNYIFLQSKYPSKDARQLIMKQIDQTFMELSEYQVKLSKNTFNLEDYQFFLQSNYMQVKDEIEQETQNQLEQSNKNQYVQHTADNMPAIKVQNKVVEGLYLGLNQYASIQWPGETPKNLHEKLTILNQSYFSSEHAFIPFINDQTQTISVYDLNNLKVHQGQIESKDELNYQATTIVLPDNKLFLSGGVNQNGFISGSTYYLNISNLKTTKISDMNVKRVGHSLCYVPPINSGQQNDSQLGYIYAIGGRTDHKIRTKLCERFNLETQQWENIGKMQNARSRAISVYSGESQSIYVFFGTDSSNQNIHTCERYDILSNKWSSIVLQNYLPGFDITFGCGIVVNKDQILLFGGLRDSIYFKDQLYFNRKLLLFNTPNDSLTVLDSYLPVDFIPLSQPVIHNNTVFAIGTFMSCTSEPPHQSLWMDGAFVLEIGQHGAKINTYLDGIPKKTQ